MNRVHLKPILQLVSLVALIVLGTVVSDRLSRESKPDFRASVKWEQLTTKESQESAPELVVHDHSRADGGYTLYPVSGTEDVLLLDPNGQVAHRWKVDVGRTVLLPNCNLLAIHASKWGLKQPKWRALRDVIREYSWEGEIVWEYKAEDEVHHDLSRLPNGNTLFLQRSMVPDSVRAKIVDESRRKNPIRSDRIVEVNSSREIVWDWYAHDHLDINSCGKPGCERFVGSSEARKKLSDWTHMNTVRRIPDNKWYRAGHSAFKPGNLLVIARSWWSILGIDRESKQVVWKYEGDHEGGLVRGHDAYMIPEGFPGAGNILVFDNGLEKLRPYSMILEINPISKKVVWSYKDEDKFYSRASGSHQRLKNGNTFISEDIGGRAFEVTSAGEIVWEVKGEHRISRAHRYPRGYCPML